MTVIWVANIVKIITPNTNWTNDLTSAYQHTYRCTTEAFGERQINLII